MAVSPSSSIHVRGLREFSRAIARAGPDAKKEVRTALRVVAEPVRVDAVAHFSSYGSTPSALKSHAFSAANYRVVVRQRGVAINSRLRKTTGKHPEYGEVQMRRALLIAAAENVALIERGMEHALSRIADHFEH